MEVQARHARRRAGGRDLQSHDQLQADGVAELTGRRAWIAVAAFAIVSSAIRLYLAHTYYGFQTGDDLEIAEEAFRRAVGLVHNPWDVRSLLIPDVLVAPFVAIAHAMGVQDPLLLATIARYPFILLSALNIVLLFMLGRRWYDDATGVIAAGLYAIHWMPLVYGSSLYPRTVAVTCILVSFGWGQTPTKGLLAALAVTARYSEAIFFGSLLLVTKREHWLRLAIGFAIGVCLFVGLYDRITWGRWFGSLIEFAELTFVRRDAASAVVRQAPWWYVTNLLHWIPATLLPLLVIAWRRGERLRIVALIALPVLALSAIFHKELRYLQVVVPFVLLFAARGFFLWDRRRVAIVLLVLAIPLGLTRIGIVQKRYTNAAAAALWMRAQRPSSVALSQAWAYGGRLFLGNEPRIVDIGIPPGPIPPTTDMVGVYSADVNDAMRAQWPRAKTFTDRGGRDVTVFFR